MNTIKTFKYLSAAAMLLASVYGTAQAAPISDVTHMSGNAVFGTVGTASISITPKTGLAAGTWAYTDGPVATGTASVTNGIVAMRWTPGVGSTNGPDSSRHAIAGDTTNASVPFIVVSENSTLYTNTASDAGYFYDPAVKGSTMNFNILVDGLNVAIPPDTYVVSLDAVVFSD